MKRSTQQKRIRCFTWRSFDRRDGHSIGGQLQVGEVPCCPCCGTLLEARPSTRLAQCLPLDARGYDLDCRDCRRFWCIVRHSARSLRLVRMRRLVAAVRALDASRSTAESQLPSPARMHAAA